MTRTGASIYQLTAATDRPDGARPEADRESVREYIKSGAASAACPEQSPQSVEINYRERRKKRQVEACDILPAVREQMVYDFHNGLRSSRKLSKKYGVPRDVVQDVVLLATRIAPRPETGAARGGLGYRLGMIDAFAQRRTA